MLATLQKWGNSSGIRIPKSMLETLRWGKNEELVITAADDKLIIERARKRKNIEELFQGYEGDYVPEEINWGAPVGNEIW